MENKALLRCKIVVVGDAQCGKTALLHVFAKDSYPEVREHFINTSVFAASAAAPVRKVHESTLQSLHPV